MSWLELLRQGAALFLLLALFIGCVMAVFGLIRWAAEEAIEEQLGGRLARLEEKLDALQEDMNLLVEEDDDQEDEPS